MVRFVGSFLGLQAVMLSATLAATVGLGVSGETSYTPGGDWESYNKTLDGQRYSPLTQINTKNASLLSEVCRVKIDSGIQFQAGPVVIKDTMFLTTATDTIALNPVTCAIKWRHTYQRSQDAWLPVNRGVAYLNGRVFRGTDEGRLFALDAKTGAELWSNIVGDMRAGQAITAAPIAWNGLVIIGVAFSEGGIRGRILAYDAATGREVWRFHTIPIGDEIGADTWPDKNWSGHGGGGTWSTFAIDPISAEVFIPVANPIPDYTPAERPGANLFTNSVVVLDARTGKLKWWYQLLANDGRDYDLAAAPMLYSNSKGEEMVAAAGKDGYLHLVNRATHAAVSKTPVTTVDEIPTSPTPEGIKACPGIAGGVLWNGPAHDPVRKTVFVGALDACSLMVSEPGSKVVVGTNNIGGQWKFLGAQTGWITAVDADTGKIRWKLHTDAPVLSGVTPTAGGIVMAGDNWGNFMMLNSDTGEILKKVATGGSMAGGLVTYEQQGKQYVAFTSGNISRTLLGAYGRAANLIVMALPKSAEAKPAKAKPRLSLKPDVNHGRNVYGALCSICHGVEGKRVPGTDMAKLSGTWNKEHLIKFIKEPSPAMAKTFAEPLDENDEADIRDVTEFLLQWSRQ